MSFKESLHHIEENPSSSDNLRVEDKIEFMKIDYIRSLIMRWGVIDFTFGICAAIAAVFMLFPSLTPYDLTLSAISRNDSLPLGVFFSIVSLLFMAQYIRDREVKYKIDLLVDIEMIKLRHGKRY